MARNTREEEKIKKKGAGTSERCGVEIETKEKKQSKKKEKKRGRSNDFITGSFIKTATTHAVKITKFSSFRTTWMHM